MRAITLAQSLNKPEEAQKLAEQLTQNNHAFQGGLEYLWVNDPVIIEKNIAQLQKIAAGNDNYAMIAAFMLADWEIGKNNLPKAKEYLQKIQQSSGGLAKSSLSQLADEILVSIP